MNQLSTETKAPSPPMTELDRILTKRARMTALLAEGLALIGEAMQESVVGDHGVNYTLQNARGWYDIHEAGQQLRVVQECQKEFDQRGWRELLRKSQLESVMHSKAKQDLFDGLRKSTPELNAENVKSVFIDMFKNRHETWKEGVVVLFQQLSNRYKSHSPFKIKARIILEGLSEYGFTFHTSSRDKLNDLERVMCLIRGTTQPESWNEKLAHKLEDAKRSGQELYLSDELKIRLFGNGNIHIWIMKPDMVDKINDIIADYYGNVLAAERAA